MIRRTFVAWGAAVLGWARLGKVEPAKPEPLDVSWSDPAANVIADIEAMRRPALDPRLTRVSLKYAKRPRTLREAAKILRVIP